VSTNQATKVNCQALHSSPGAQLPLAGHEPKFHIRVAKNAKKT